MTQRTFSILFIDIDDVIVLSRTAEFDKHAVGELSPAICQRLIHAPAGQALMELLDEHPSRLVITSNWVRFTQKSAFERLFRLAGYERLSLSLHENWSAPRGSAATRVQVIDDWLATHHRGEPYCVIDDPASGSSLLDSSHDKAGRVLLCDVGTGLHRGHLPFIRAALSKDA